ncbi:MAG: UDP-glucose--hexose-1-phosphate uridylyltransferase [Chitinispirillaceae bacterium]|nr:UDP-glucose--hexose-1-phosphate uridylyltransferase [Chitinispirillaceae bacterium]
MSLFEHPHRRYNPLSNEWILVSPHRTKRPWQGKTDEIRIPESCTYDPGCYLCPGNKRADGDTNPAYQSTFIFRNDFSALYPQVPDADIDEGGLLRAHSEKGICRVICYSPRHDLTMPLMEPEAIRSVVDLWTDQYRELGELEHIGYVQIFENKGSQMGCSNPHPHGQIWADEQVPQLPARECTAQKEYHESHSSCLLCDYLARELKKGERIVFENGSFAVLVPFWAIWPYEVMLLPKQHHASLLTLSDNERNDLADALKRTGTRYDNLFSTSFPYSMGIHQQPTDGNDHPEWHVHFHFFPPLLRSATVKKFMVGYELLAMPQRDITAELAAANLRKMPETHFLVR